MLSEETAEPGVFCAPYQTRAPLILTASAALGWLDQLPIG
jgi:hypothetical protein